MFFFPLRPSAQIFDSILRHLERFPPNLTCVFPFCHPGIGSLLKRQAPYQKFPPFPALSVYTNFPPFLVLYFFKTINAFARLKHSALLFMQEKFEILFFLDSINTHPFFQLNAHLGNTHEPPFAQFFVSLVSPLQ